MSGNTVIWIAGLICTALYLYTLTLPPDKPTDDERHCHGGTDAWCPGPGRIVGKAPGRGSWLS